MEWKVSIPSEVKKHASCCATDPRWVGMARLPSARPPHSSTLASALSTFLVLSPRLLSGLLSYLRRYRRLPSLVLCRFSLSPPLPCLLPKRDRHCSEAKRCPHVYLPSTTQLPPIPLLTVSISSPQPPLARHVRSSSKCDRVSE